MSTYALFIAANPEPVSESGWTGIDQVYDRARLSSGGTKVHVRSASNGGHTPDDFDIEVATFVNGIQLEVRDDGPEAFSYYGDGQHLGAARLSGAQWVLTADPSLPDADPNTVAFEPDAGHTRREIQIALGKFVEDWLQ